MVEFLYTGNLLHFGGKEICPVVGWDYGASILSRHKLGVIALGRAVDDISDGLKAPYLGSSIHAFQQTKTPVGCKLCMTHN